MDNLLTVAFEAHNAGKNHHRRYQVTVGRDLFDAWTVAIEYGRVGRDGQQKRFASLKAEEMRQVIGERLRRRLSATQRIGCAYHLTRLEMAEGFDSGAWLPDEVMASFSRQGDK
jgi:predicted DNA-binding WGR domain protein